MVGGKSTGVWHIRYGGGLLWRGADAELQFSWHERFIWITAPRLGQFMRCPRHDPLSIISTSCLRVAIWFTCFGGVYLSSELCNMVRRVSMQRLGERNWDNTWSGMFLPIRRACMTSCLEKSHQDCYVLLRIWDAVLWALPIWSSWLIFFDSFCRVSTHGDARAFWPEKGAFTKIYTTMDQAHVSEIYSTCRWNHFYGFHKDFLEVKLNHPSKQNGKLADREVIWNHWGRLN